MNPTTLSQSVCSNGLAFCQHWKRPQEDLRCFLGTTPIVTVFCSGFVVWVYSLAKSRLQTSPLNGTICSRAKRGPTLKLRSLEGFLHSAIPMGHSAAHCNTTHCNALQLLRDGINDNVGMSFRAQHSPRRYDALQHTATRCNTLQHTATYCNTLQHTAKHCKTLQHTATHCNTL